MSFGTDGVRTIFFGLLLPLVLRHRGGFKWPMLDGALEFLWWFAIAPENEQRVRSRGNAGASYSTLEALSSGQHWPYTVG